MPAQDQIRKTASDIPNPFEDAQPKVNVFTAQEIATLQSKLNKQLGPEYLSTRKGPGGTKLHYIAGEKVINLANEVFGFNGWSSAIQNVQIDFCDEDRSNRTVSLGLSIICRITLKDGTYHEDVGYGSIENAKGKAAAFEKAKKEAATDAMKRALRNFGNVLGNCVYDKTYLKTIEKVKLEPTKRDFDKGLYRHPDFDPNPQPLAIEGRIKQEQSITRIPSIQSVQSYHSVGAESEEDFGGGMFDEVDFHEPLGDSAILHDDSGISLSGSERARSPVKGPTPVQRQPPIQRVQSMPSLQANANMQQRQSLPQNARPPVQTPSVQPAGHAQLQPPNGSRERMPTPPHPPNANPQAGPPNRPVEPTRPQVEPQTPQHAQQDATRAANIPAPPGFPPAPAPASMPTVGFVSSRAAELLQKTDAPPPITQHAFNLHAESPSIRRTNGVNHRSSVPISREAATSALNQSNTTTTPAQAASSNIAASYNANVNNIQQRAPTVKPDYLLNPQADATRRIGAPNGVGSPSRPVYRPPTVAGVKRAPLSDVSNVQLDEAGAGAGIGQDVKKIKMDGA